MDERKYRIRIAVTLISLAAAVTVAFTYRRRRKAKERYRSSCYLHAEGKPQFGFRKVFADNSFSHFKHSKTNSSESRKAENGSSLHPYEQEIKALLDTPPAEFEFDVTSWSKELSDSYVWIETESQLKELAELLSKERVFGVDTEQHSLRSFLGFTALIQISTGSEDYLIDTIALHDSMGVLGPVFADPNICKVFHGADNDVLWLQRDFQIYVVNLFDTAKACEVLSKPQKSLAYLLETYCGVYSNKLLQREDWRLRPLSPEMLEYAQMDAHYLLYIAHCLIGELRHQDVDNSPSPDEKLQYVEATRRSNMICMQLYTKEIDRYPGEAAASSILFRHFDIREGSSISSETQDLVKRLCTWRELMARVHDESLRYVLSDQAIVSIAGNFPTDLTELCQLIADADNQVDPVNSASFLALSTVVTSHLDDLFDVIQDIESSLDDVERYPNRKGVEIQNKHARLHEHDSILLKSSPVKLQYIITAGFMQTTGVCFATVTVESLNGISVETWRSLLTKILQPLCFFSNQRAVQRTRTMTSTSRVRGIYASAVAKVATIYAHAAAEKHKRKIAAQYGIPLFVRRVVDSKEATIIPETDSSIGPADEPGVSPLQLRTAAMALLRHGKRMPLQRHDELIQIVMQYYGGREVSEDDLERALLVGMSPHERRRFRKKRGSMSTKQSLGNPEEEHGGSNGAAKCNAEVTPKDKPLLQKDQTDPTEKEMNENSNHDERVEGSVVNDEDEETNGTYSSKNNSKLSLLGHGPHGKQVVEHLMNEEGEDGIRQFCQTWRQVFVEALNPRFLPAGWTVMHSGRRDFGEFSVYNPAKKAIPEEVDEK
ncbi:Protein RRP6-like 3 [Linum grandiflorum]